MTIDIGRDPLGQALAVPATPANAVDGPSGFDPSRDETDCPYELTDGRAIERAMAWHEGYRAALRWMMESAR